MGILAGLEAPNTCSWPDANTSCATRTNPQPKVSVGCAAAVSRTQIAHRQYIQRMRARWPLSPLAAVADTRTRRSSASAPRQQPQDAAGTRPSDCPRSTVKCGRIGVNNRVHSVGAGRSAGRTGATTRGSGRYCPMPPDGSSTRAGAVGTAQGSPRPPAAQL